MSVVEIFSIAGAVLASLGGGAAIVLALSSWLGKVWANRLMEADKSRYAKELETAKAELTRISQDRTRKLESLKRHYERQIEEFYGPLFNMVHQVFVANHIQWELLSARDNNGQTIVREDSADKIRDYFHNTYFSPLHDEIRQILRTKLYLIEGSEMPKSFYLYLKHAAQEHDQRRLWRDYKIDTSFLRGESWPNNFYEDIKSGFEIAMRNYEMCLEGMKA